MKNSSTPYTFALPPNAGKANLNESDNRIIDAVQTLRETQSGQKALRDLRIFLNANQQGLDIVNAEAVVTLMGEFFINHRRSF